MADQIRDTSMDVHGPKFKWEWSPNTIVMLVGFASGFVAWGYAYADMMSAKTIAAAEIGELWIEVKRLDESNRRFDNVEYRVTVVEATARERVAADAITAQAINSLVSDTRVNREILQRIEAASLAAKP